MDMEKEPINSKQPEGFEEEKTAEQTEATQSPEPADHVSEPAAEDALLSEEEIQGSTIFSKNQTEERPKPTASGRKKRRRLFIALIAVAVVAAAAIFAVLKFLPEKEGNTETTEYSIKVKSVSANDIEKIEIDNSYGKLVFTSTVVQNTSSSGSESGTLEQTVTWKLEGFEESLIASSSVNAAADSIASINAVREMTDRSLDYGLDSPTVTAKVTMRNGGEGYTVTVGNMAPDKTGYYLTVSGDEKIYLVSAGSVNNFDTTPEKLANTVIVTAPTKDSNTKTADKKYFDDEGNIASFDSIELSGSKYGQAVSLLSQSDNDMAEYIIKMGNSSRYADSEKVEAMFGLMTNGLVAIDTYKLNPSAADIKQYGLDAPEAVIEIKAGSYTVKMKASLYDKEKNYYAVIVEGRDAIYAATADALSMLDYTVSDFYNQFVFLEYLHDFSNMTVKTPDKTYSFDISYDESEEKISALMGGKAIDDALLSAYYQYYVTLAPTAQSEYTAGSSALTATFTYRDTAKGKHVVELVKQTERRYLVVVDGQKMGLVNSAVFDHLVEYAQYVVDGKGIPDAS